MTPYLYLYLQLSSLIFRPCSLGWRLGKCYEQDKAAAIRFEQGPVPGPTEPWRCATCYRGRFETMCFGLNEPGVTRCQHPHCGGALIEDCGWSLTLPWAALPKGVLFANDTGSTSQNC